KVRSRHRIESVDAFIKPHAGQHQPQQQQRDPRRYEEYRRSNSQPTFAVRANYNQPQPAQALERQQHHPQMQRQPQYQQQSFGDTRFYQQVTTTAYPHWNRQQNVNFQQPNNYRTSSNVHGGFNENVRLCLSLFTIVKIM
ncbi:hypothetical protein OESDEN_23767, partial [Oesophagostomum dentatum]